MSLSRTYHPNHELKAEIRTDLGFQSKPAVFRVTAYSRPSGDRRAGQRPTGAVCRRRVACATNLIADAPEGVGPGQVISQDVSAHLRSEEHTSELQSR